MGPSEKSTTQANIDKLNEIPHDILKRQIVTYFETQKAPTKQHPQPRPFSLPSLALALGVTLRDLVLYPEGGIHSSLIYNAKAVCEADLVDRMMNKMIDRSTGHLLLKNHFGYMDIQKALTDEEKKKQRIANALTKRSISDILDEIEMKNK
jgi:hypothetical protein